MMSAKEVLDALTCEYQGCSVTRLDGDHFCIFHSENLEKDPEAFREALATKTDSNFAGYVFPVDLDFSGKNLVNADFSSARFEKTTHFNSAKFDVAVNFRGASFAGIVNFRGASFAGTVDFREAKFTANAYFNRARFAGDAIFKGAQFAGVARFIIAKFQAGAIFSEVNLAADAVFSGSNFAEVAGFDRVNFAANADFRTAKFGACVSFYRANFAANADFVGSDFAPGAYFKEAKFANANFRMAKFAEADFIETKFATGASFDHATFVGRALFEQTEWACQASFRRASVLGAVFRDCHLQSGVLGDATGLEHAHFENVRWGHEPARIWRWWLPEKVGPLQFQRQGVVGDEVEARSSKKPEDYARAERVYHRLLKNYEGQRDFELAEEFHYGEMEMRRLEGFEPILTIYGALSGYGHRWWQALGWLFMVILIWAGIYGLSGLDTATPAKAGGVPQMVFAPARADWGLTFDTIIYSARSVVLQPDKDIWPKEPFARLAQLVEFVLGPLLIGLTGLALRRKFRR